MPDRSMCPPVCAPLPPSAGVGCGPRTVRPAPTPRDCSYLCACCAAGRPPPVTACYKQPPIPDSYAPRRAYRRPTAPVESCTTYNLSYLPNESCGQIRGEQKKPLPNIVPSCEPMECGTIQKLSFRPNPVAITQAYRPCHHDMWGQGPMQTVTTQRHDYVPKPSILRESCRPPHKFHAVETPFENRTINRMSFIDPCAKGMRPSFAPIRYYEKPSSRMDCTTTQKLSYQPVCVTPPQRPPWACKGQYQKPCSRVDSGTTYNLSYLPPGQDCEMCVDPCCCGDCPCPCPFPRAAC